MLRTVGLLFAPIPSSPGAAFFRGALGAPAERAGVRLSRRQSCVRKSVPAASKSAPRSNAPGELKIGAPGAPFQLKSFCLGPQPVPAGARQARQIWARLCCPRGGFTATMFPEFVMRSVRSLVPEGGGVKIGSGWRAHYRRAIEALLVQGMPEEWWKFRHRLSPPCGLVWLCKIFRMCF